MTLIHGDGHLHALQPGVDIDTRIQQLEQSLKAKAADSSTATTTTTTTTTSGAE